MEEGLTRARVLIIEDEADVRHLIALLLKARGCEVVARGNAAEALPELLAGDYDLVLCDLRMPGMDGRTLYEQVKAERPELAQRFLICTGDNLSTETEEFLQESRLPVLMKPFRAEELLIAVLPFFRKFSPKNS